MRNGNSRLLAIPVFLIIGILIVIGVNSEFFKYMMKSDENPLEYFIPKIDESYVAGVIEDDTYTSEYLNFTFTLPEGYQFMDDDMLLGDYTEDQKKEAEEYMSIEMLASRDEMLPMMLIAADKTDAKYTASEFSEKMGNYVAGSNANSYKVAEESVNVVVAGEIYSKIKLRMDVGSTSADYDIFVREINGHMVCIALVYETKRSATAYEVLNRLQPLE